MNKPEDVKPELPKTKEQFERRYAENWEVSGFGLYETTNHFPCPFCAAKDWYVVPVMGFGSSTDPIKCEECSRSARFVVTSTPQQTTMELVQVAGEDPPPWSVVRRVPA